MREVIRRVYLPVLAVTIGVGLTVYALPIDSDSADAAMMLIIATSLGGGSVLALRCRAVVTADEITIHNPWRSRRIPLDRIQAIGYAWNLWTSTPVLGVKYLTTRGEVAVETVLAVPETRVLDVLEALRSRGVALDQSDFFFHGSKLED